LLLGTDQYGRTAWPQAADRGRLETLQKVWECAKEILTKGEINKLFLFTDNLGKTSWQLAGISGNSKTLLKEWHCAKDILRTEEFNKLL